MTTFKKSSEKTRTEQQNNALHKYFSDTADALQKEGITLNKLIEDRVEIMATKHSLKEMWRSIQVAMFGKKSTTELTTKEIDQVFDVMNKLLAERGGIHIPFPSIDSLIEDQKEIDNKTR